MERTVKRLIINFKDDKETWYYFGVIISNLLKMIATSWLVVSSPYRPVTVRAIAVNTVLCSCGRDTLLLQCFSRLLLCESCQSRYLLQLPCLYQISQWSVHLLEILSFLPPETWQSKRMKNCAWSKIWKKNTMYILLIVCILISMTKKITVLKLNKSSVHS